MKSIKENNFLTKKELLFIYLLNHTHQKDNYVCPESITQTGIQKELDCTIGFLSRILKENEQNGHICREKTKIFNKKNKQYAYFLTEDGVKLASDIKKMINMGVEKLDSLD